MLTWLNDFIFCPISIYFHNLYGDRNKVMQQGVKQIDGSAAHEAVDSGTYSTKKSIITGLYVYSEEYGIEGKIDIFNETSGELIERKKRIKVVYDGYVFQLYGQYYAMKEMGYYVKKLTLRSLDDNRSYNIPLPENDEKMRAKFEETVRQMQLFDGETFIQENADKCRNCIYEPACDRSLL